jgi:hypothetical protein
VIRTLLRIDRRKGVNQHEILISDLASGTVSGYLCLSYESGRSDSNRRRPAWEAGILPLNYARRGFGGDGNGFRRLARLYHAIIEGYASTLVYLFMTPHLPFQLVSHTSVRPFS